MIEFREHVGAVLRVRDQVEQDPLFLELEVAEKMGDIGRMGLVEDFCRLGNAPRRISRRVVSSKSW